MHDQAGEILTRAGRPDPLAFLRVRTAADFDALYARLRAYQAGANPVYGRFLAEQGEPPVPYLPVEAFKAAAVACFPPEEAALVFESSATGGRPSRHYLADEAPYRASLLAGFDRVFGRGPFRLLACVPGYDGNPRSSLVHMLRVLIEERGIAGSGFVQGRDELARRLAGASGGPCMVFGAAFGLLDLIEAGPIPLPEGAVVVETGGMKTFRRSVRREDLHRSLAAGFAVPRERVFSEYGMCELLSQAYSRGGPSFDPPPWMRLVVLRAEDPHTEAAPGASGRLAVVDLANTHSAVALLTSDRARRRPDGGVEILGRLTGAEARGCNHLVDRVG